MRAQAEMKTISVNPGIFGMALDKGTTKLSCIVTPSHAISMINPNDQHKQ